LTKSLNNLYSQIYNAQPKASYYNTGAAYASALKQGGAQADALYNKQLNELNTQMSAQQQTAQQQQELSNSIIQQTLQNTLQGNDITGQRVGEDTSTALGNLANAQQNYKQTEGMQFDQAQRALGTQLGQAGTAESGGGQQQVATAQKQEQLGQQAQGQQYQIQRQGQQVFANRSFEDLARSSGIAKEQAGTQTSQTKLDLNKSLQQISQYQTQQQQSLLQSRNAYAAAGANAIYDTNLGNFLNSLYGKVRPEDYSATAQAYQMR
jgi:hypothetical protein